MKQKLQLPNNLCNKCGANPKYPRQGLCFNCLREKQKFQYEAKKPIYAKIENLEGELWCEIEGANGYFISSKGRIKCSSYYKEQNREHLLKLRPARKDSYFKIDLDKYNWRPSVHRLVGKCFVPNPFNKPFINHKDGNKQNNNADNLEWNTHSENTIHAVYVLKANWLVSNIKPIYQIDKDTERVIKKFDSIAIAGNELGINKSNITQCAKARKSCLTAGGFKWKYA